MKQVKGQIDIFEYLKPKPVEIKGFMSDGWCPNCDTNLDDLIPVCPYCNTTLNWERWENLSKEES